MLGQGRLAGPIMADNGYEFAAGNRQINIAEGNVLKRLALVVPVGHIS